jgi:hypothetical protein
MAKLAGSDCEMILKLAGDVIGDKGFIGTNYIITPVRKPKHRDLSKGEHDYNNQISSLRAPVERAVANLKTWRILFTDYRRPLKTFMDVTHYNTHRPHRALDQRHPMRPKTPSDGHQSMYDAPACWEFDQRISAGRMTEPRFSAPTGQQICTCLIA